MRAQLIATLLAAVSIETAVLQTEVAAQASRTLTSVAGIKVGHHTLSERPTGCTVILAEAGATAGVDVRGAAPATRETDVLSPVNTVQVAHAIVLSGGSAFGLDSASGVMRYLEEKQIGFPFGFGLYGEYDARKFNAGISWSPIGMLRLKAESWNGRVFVGAQLRSPVSF